MSLPGIVERFLDAQWSERGLRENTLASYRADLKGFSTWLADQKIALTAASVDDIRSYLRHRNEAGLKATSNARLLSTLRRFFRWAESTGEVSADPTARLVNPRRGRPLPKTLSEAQVEALLDIPDTDAVLGMRDKAMLETLYATGLRVSELVGLIDRQLHLQRGVVSVTGKGGKERLVPLGEIAVDWLERYLQTARPELAKGSANDAVFLSRRGQPMTRQAFWYRVKARAKAAGVDVPVSPHTLRHAFATHLLNHGADLRVVQMLLGHSDLSTTQIYTHIAKHGLKQLHRHHHPRG